MTGAFELGQARALLSRTPAVLEAWLRGLPAAWLEADEGAATWSPRVVLGHLVHGERTDWMERVRRILEHGEALAFEPFDREAQLRLTPPPSASELLDEFARLRRANLNALDALALSSSDLERRGLHPALGSVTLRQLLATWTAHDQVHLAQIARTLARRYDSEVGPWREYMPLLAADGRS